MSTDGLRIEEVTELQQVTALARLADLALRPDPFHAFAAKYASKPTYEETIDRLTAAIEDPKSYVFRAMLPETGNDGNVSERLVGFTQWYIGYLEVPKVDPFAPRPTLPEPQPDITEIAVAESEAAAETAPEEQPVGHTNPNPFDFVAREIGNCHVRAIRGKRHIYLRRMIVDPDHQGKGIGQKLLQWGVDLADREKIVGWLWARPAAARLYEKNGWKALDSVPIDAPGMTVAPLVSMLRLPRPQESPSG